MRINGLTRNMPNKGHAIPTLGEFSYVKYRNNQVVVNISEMKRTG